MKNQKAVKPNKSISPASSKYIDYFVYLFCIAGMAISLNFFRLDLFRTLTRQAEQAVGIITFKYNAAQRRFSNRVLWDRLRQESPVYNGDFIRTAALSEATITFTEGSAINLGENSLIRIQRDDAGAFIDIREGGISAHADSAGLVLSFGDNQVTVNPGAVINTGMEDGNFLLQVVEGDAVLSGKNGTETVSAGQIFVPGVGILAEAAALSPRPAARLLNPNPGKLTVPFRWSRASLEPEKLVRFELAEDRGFTRLVVRQDLAGETSAVELDAGSYFWRLSVVDGENPPSPRSSNTFSLRVIAAIPPALIAPPEGYEYQFRAKKPVVRFQWAEAAGITSYVVEVADNREMENPGFSREVWGTSFYSSELGPGTWYWRVQPVFSGDYQGTVGKGAPGSFRITQSGNLRAPVLRAPADQGMVNIAAGRGDFYFSWQNEPEARSYTILISENQDLRDPLITGTVPNNFYVYRAGEKILKPGLYYWGIFQRDAEGNPSALSSVRSFTALEGELIQRTIFPPDGYIIGSTVLPELQFTWRTNLPQQTRLQISNQADFSRLAINTAVSDGTFRGRELPPGTWYWRIQTQGTGISFETPAKTFIVVPPLPAPVLEQPDPARPVLLQEERPVIFSWQAPPGAEYYQLKLYRGENRSRPLYEEGLTEETTRFIPMDRYPEGTYYWTVQAFTRETTRSTRQTGYLGEGVFITQRPLRTIIPDISQDSVTFEEPRTISPDASRESLALEEPRIISPDASRESLAFEESRTKGPDTSLDIVVFEEPRTTVPDSTGAFPRSIPIPPLPEAANRLPRDGTLINKEELKQNRKLIFSWDAVPGASGYLFTLMTAGENKEILRVGPQKATVFILEDLTLLDVGRFIWRVEAIMEEGEQNKAENQDSTIRYGQGGENQFTLEFTPPDTPVPLKPGLLYGRN